MKHSKKDSLLKIEKKAMDEFNSLPSTFRAVIPIRNFGSATNQPALEKYFLKKYQIFKSKYLIRNMCRPGHRH
jgi:hypothetical protein